MKKQKKEPEIVIAITINRKLVRALQNADLVADYTGHYEIEFGDGRKFVFLLTDDIDAETVTIAKTVDQSKWRESSEVTVTEN